MTPERWREVRATFDRLVAGEEGARAGALSALDRDDPELAKEVRAILAAEARELRFPGEPGPKNTLPDRRGERVGAWELLSPLGEGGMGRVHLARRADAAFDKLVAVKFVHAELLSPWLRERFAAERHALAALEHQGIARLLDGGEAGGEPFLVLEYVDGRPLLAYAAERSLATRARVELFLQVLAAVAHAHRHLVVHRDLKPTNILVTADGEAKLLDFGIAKILAPEGGAAANTTRTFLRAMTPEYASPEQVLGGPTTTATDIYALGVVLFELLTGRRPYRVSTGAASEWAEAALHQEVARAPELDRDLDAIVGRALRKSAAERYATADAFADDLRAYLDGRPVAARRGNTAYRAAKFIVRHRTALAASTLAIALLATTLTLSAIRLRRERDRAERRFADTRELANRFLFRFHDAIATLPGATSARELVVATGVEFLDRLASEGGDDPALARELAAGYQRLGTIQGGLLGTSSVGKVGEAIESYRKGLALAERAAAALPGDEAARHTLVQLSLALGDAEIQRGDGAAAERLHRRAWELARGRLAAAPDDAGIRSEAVGAAGHLADSLTLAGRPAETGNVLQELARLLDAGKSTSEEQLRSRAAVDNRLAYAEAMLEHWPEALAAAKRYRDFMLARSAAAEDNAPEMFELATALGQFGWISSLGGEPEEALSALAEARIVYTELARADLKDRSPREGLAIVAEGEGEAYARQGRLERSREAFREAVSRYEPLIAEDSQNAYFRAFLGYELTRVGELSLELGEMAPARAALASALETLKGDAVGMRDGQLARVRALAAAGGVGLREARSLAPAARRGALELAAGRFNEARERWREIAAGGAPLPPSQLARVAALERTLREVEAELAGLSGT